MTFLAPALLALGLAVAVPLALHLLQRRPGPRVVFPAFRYLRQAERSHSVGLIRLRHIALLALRMGVLLLLAASAARPFLRDAGDGHDPTAVAIVLDNSASTGAVVGDARVLDGLKRAALETLEAMDVDDRVWLIRAGAPWDAAVTGEPAMVAGLIRETEPTHAGADLVAELERAGSIVGPGREPAAAEIHLLSDLQATGFRAAPRGTEPPAETRPPGPAHLVAYAPDSPGPPNRWVESVQVGGGFNPRAGERSTVAVTVAGWGTASDSVPVRLVLEGTVRAAGLVSPGTTATLPFPAHPPGRVAGYVELDADALVADDRRHFVIDVVPATRVALGASAVFLEEALEVLVDAGRIQRVAVAEADVVMAPGGRSAEAIREGSSVVVLPPARPLELGATNQRLAAAGIPWRYQAPRGGVARLDTTGLPRDLGLEEVRLSQVYGLAGEAGDSVPVRLTNGEPWAVLGGIPDGGRFALLGSPLTPEAGTLATSAAMVPFVDLLLTTWTSGGSTPSELVPGSLITVTGDAVSGPDGLEPTSPGSSYRVRTAGIYRVLSGTDTVAAHAVNLPAAESRPERFSAADVEARLAEITGSTVRVAAPGGWRRAIFQQRPGREITRWLLVAALLLLGVEMALAATGRGSARLAGTAEGVAR